MWLTPHKSENREEDAPKTSLANVEGNRNFLFIFFFNLRLSNIAFEIIAVATNVEPQNFCGSPLNLVRTISIAFFKDLGLGRSS